MIAEASNNLGMLMFCARHQYALDHTLKYVQILGLNFEEFHYAKSQHPKDKTPPQGFVCTCCGSTLHNTEGLCIAAVPSCKYCKSAPATYYSECTLRGAVARAQVLNIIWNKNSLEDCIKYSEWSGKFIVGDSNEQVRRAFLYP